MAAKPKAPPNNDLANAMREGLLAAACLGDVPDGPVLGRDAAGVLAAIHKPQPSQLYQHRLERVARMDVLVAHHGVVRAFTAADPVGANQAGEPAIIADVDGSIFSMASWSGLRKPINAASSTCSLCITPRTLSGDFQTGAPSPTKDCHLSEPR